MDIFSLWRYNKKMRLKNVKPHEKESEFLPRRCAICHENPPNRENVASRRCVRLFLWTFGSVLCIMVYIRRKTSVFLFILPAVPKKAHLCRALAMHVAARVGETEENKDKGRSVPKQLCFKQTPVIGCPYGAPEGFYPKYIIFWKGKRHETPQYARACACAFGSSHDRLCAV